MEIGEYRYKKTELLKLSEEIYQYKGRKQQLELDLFSEQFHRRYIPKRKQMLKHRVWNNRPIIIVAAIVFCVSIGIVVDYFMNGDAYREDGPSGVIFLFATLLCVFIPYLMRGMVKEQIAMKVRLKRSSDSDKALRFADKYDVDTLEVDDVRNKQRIDTLVNQIEEINKKIEELENIRYELIKEAKKKNRFDDTWELKAHEDKPVNAAGLNLRESEYDNFDIKELFAYYTTAENYVLRNIEDLNVRLNNTNKSITKVNDDFERSKMVVVAYVICLFIVGLIGVFLKGGVLTIYSIVRLILAFIGLIFVDRYIKNLILFYLIENESSFVDEYVFVNDIVPYKIQRQNLIELIDDSEKELNDIRKKKRELDND